MYQIGYDAGQEQAESDKRMGRPADPHSNHPNAIYRIGWFDGYQKISPNAE